MHTSDVSPHSPNTVGFSLTRLAGAVVILLALGLSLTGAASQCQGSTPRSSFNSTGVTHHQHHTGAVAEIRTTTVGATIRPAQRLTPKTPRCGPVPVSLWGLDSATARPVRTLDDVLQPRSSSIQSDLSAAQAHPSTQWARSSSAHTPPDYSSDSPLAQEPMGILRSVVLRL